MNNRRAYEVLIVGGGIAGASLAYFLASRGLTDVLLLEKEEQPGTHATGRSASVLVRLDSVPTVLQLKILAAGFFRDPPAGFCENPVLEPSGILSLYAEPLWSLTRGILPWLHQQGVRAEILSPEQVLSRVPVLSKDFLDGGILLPDDGRLDVHELLWGYLRGAKRRGVEVLCGVEVNGIEVERGQCTGVLTNRGRFLCDRIVNAAGAWAGLIGRMARAATCELRALRRTIVAFDAPEGHDPEGWPFVANESHHLYFGAESRGLIASPMDEAPVAPGDPRPEELVVAQTLDLLGRLAPPLLPRTLRRTWAGLRTFAPDRGFVIGEDPVRRGFFWLAGLGGSGIETSPAVGEIAADLLLKGKTERFDASLLSPSRFL